MLYYLCLFRQYWSPLNVFQYITFRAAFATLTALLLSLSIGPILIRKLKAWKEGPAPRKDVPLTHQTKAGTPIMGGLLILLSTLVSSLLWAKPADRFIGLMMGVTLLLGILGFADDYRKWICKHREGLPSWIKLAVQVAIATAVVAYLAVHPPHPQFSTMVYIPYTKNHLIYLGSLYYFMAILMIVGSSNAVNLTDGLDGLAVGNLIFCTATFVLFAYLAGHAKFSQYLGLIHVAEAGEIAVFLSALVGAELGFLWFNAYPAQVFMGDTSSLLLGGVLATAALVTKQELILPIVEGIFLAEALSVILQMASYRLRRGKRIFRMAPLHHHYEIKGWPEPKVTVRFWILGMVLSLIALASLKIH